MRASFYVTATFSIGASMYTVAFIQNGAIVALADFASRAAAAGHIFSWRALGAGHEVIA